MVAPASSTSGKNGVEAPNAAAARHQFQSQPALFGTMMEYGTSYDAVLQIVPGDPNLCAGHEDLMGGNEGGEELRPRSYSFPEAKADARGIRVPIPVDGTKRIALLAERGGCSFETKARAAMAIDAKLRARNQHHALSPIISFVVVYDDAPRPTLVPMSASSTSDEADLSGISLVFVSYESGTALLGYVKKNDKNDPNNKEAGVPITIDAAAPWGGYGFIYQTSLYGEDYPQEFVLAALAGFFMCLTLLGCLLLCAQAGIISTDGSAVVFGRSLADEITARRQFTGRNTGRPKFLTEDQVSALSVVQFRSELGASIARIEKAESMPITGGSSIGHHSLAFDKRSHSTSDTSNWTARNDSMCDICLEDYTEGEYLLELPCGHKYHTQCIRPWLTERSTLCPHCRTDVLDADPCFSGATSNTSQYVHNLLLPPERFGYGSIGLVDYSPLRYMHGVAFSESSMSHAESDGNADGT
eukprot:CAMPEP_0197725502 /NCGR_PEP_ID=MMETSP1434-20131217/7010_1 /TAXON_ID=265543 /ORGANISM="Minutocellus polymorphus, Strain CCMP3303" /LENGTH=471 /DNA_ID=CAMNT_0043310979 /DNA_START=69 /DNA_END=1484 /DNA_ORIENTATION=-